MNGGKPSAFVAAIDNRVDPGDLVCADHIARLVRQVAEPWRTAEVGWSCKSPLTVYVHGGANSTTVFLCVGPLHPLPHIRVLDKYL